MSWLDTLFPGGTVTQYGPSDATAGLSGAYNATEPGIDIGLPVGTPVRAPYGGTVVGNTGNEVIIQFGRVLEDLMHIRGGPAVGSVVTPGQQVGTVGGADIGATADHPYYSGGHWYTSSGAHFEAGFYPLGVTPGDAAANQSLNAAQYLAAAPAAGSLSAPNPITATTPDGSTVTMPFPGQKGGGPLPNPNVHGGDPLAGWPIDPLHWGANIPTLPDPAKVAGGVLSTVARLALTGLFAIGALLIGLLLLDRLTGGNNVGKLASTAKLAAL